MSVSQMGRPAWPDPRTQSGPGRPPRLNREMILEAVAEMLRREPDAPLTMARAAAAVDASPMSLYRYFADRDDLVVSVTRHVLREDDVDAEEGTPWSERLRSWMINVCRKAVSHRPLFELAASGRSPAWLTCSARLADILEEAGFDDEGELAAAVYLVGTVTLGQAMVAAASAEYLSLPRLYGALGHLTADEAARVGALIPHFGALGDRGLELVVDRVVAAVSDMAGGCRLPEAPRRLPGQHPGPAVTTGPEIQEPTTP